MYGLYRISQATWHLPAHTECRYAQVYVYMYYQ